MAARSLDDSAFLAVAIGEPESSEPELSLDGSGHVENGSATRHDPVPVPAPPDLESALSRTIASEVIPRLVMAHRRAAPARAPIAQNALRSAEDIERLSAISISGSLPAAREFVDALHARGVSVEAILSEVLPGAARHVGWLWETDACTFVDVTFALSRLQQLLRHYAPALEIDLPQTGAGRRVLLTIIPGEQHTFGLSVVEEFLRRAAWDVAPFTPTAVPELLDVLRNEWFDVVALSASGDGPLASMTALLQSVRDASCNRSVRVIIGGAAVLRCPDIAAASGADAIARDPKDGIAQMEWMMQSLRQPC